MPINKLSDKTIFNAVRVIDSPEGQQAYMQQACGDDVDQQSRVAALLHKFQPNNQFLESTASELHLFLDAPRVLETPTQIGPYRICEQIGEGGMGVVYLAQQTTPVRRKVALKVIKPGMDTTQVIARFDAERQALAVMNHPGIARIFDAGMTEEGRPFFVMELIRGVRIDKYCDDAKLTVKDRLNLFIDVCQAIQHAHQKGVIHRDLKPSNILVTLHDGIPVVKVIDFGIAKALDHDLTERTLFTHSSEMIGTPAYMSPEQLEMSGLDVDTRSDVYSLGVLLYKLLAGVTPFDKNTLNSASPDELRRIIREDEPPRPSRRFSTLNNELISTISERRGIDIPQLALSMQRELDWIVMKALEKDRTRRYESASVLAADLQRYLDGDVVEACPPSALYRLEKHVRRNKTLFIISVAVAISLLIGTIGTTWQWLRATQKQTQTVAALELAEKNLQLALDAVDKLLEHASNPDLAQVPLVQPTRKRILEDALNFYEQFHLASSDSANLRLSAAVTRLRLGGLAIEMGQNDLSEKMFVDAQVRLEELAHQFPNVASYRHELAAAHMHLGWFYDHVEPDFEKAIGHFENANAEFKLLAGLVPNQSTVYQAKATRALQHMAGTFRRMGQEDRSRELTFANYKRISQLEGPGNILRDKTYVTLKMVGILESTDPARAESLYLELVEISRQHYEAFFNRGTRRSHALLLVKAAEFLKTRDHKSYEELSLEAVKISEELVSEFPTSPVYELQLGQALKTRISLVAQDISAAELLSLLGKCESQFPDHAIPLHEVYARRLASEQHPVETLSAAIKTYPQQYVYFQSRGDHYLAVGDFDSAIADFAEALKLAPGSYDEYGDLHRICVKMSDAHFQNKNFEQAVDVLNPACNALQAGGGHIYKRRAKALFALNRFEESLTDLNTSLDRTPSDASALVWIGMEQISDCSDDAFRNGLRMLADRAVALNDESADSLVRRAQVLIALDDQQQAREDLDAAVATDEAPFHFWYWYCAALLAAASDDAARYQELCRQILAKFESSEIAEELHFAAWTCALHPRATDDYELASKLSQLAVDADPANQQFAIGVGALQLRAGEYAKALESLAAAAGKDESSNTSNAYSVYFRSMTEYRLDRHQDAIASLTRANELAEQELSNPDDSPAWNQKLTLELLRKEAETLIGKQEDIGPQRKLGTFDTSTQRQQVNQ